MRPAARRCLPTAEIERPPAPRFGGFLRGLLRTLSRCRRTGGAARFELIEASPAPLSFMRPDPEPGQCQATPGRAFPLLVTAQ